MSVFGGILLFVSGVATGSGAIILHQRDVKRESARLRRENEHLKTSAWNDRLEFETYRAYGDGYYDGRGAALEASVRPSTVWPLETDPDHREDPGPGGAAADAGRIAKFPERRIYRYPKEDAVNDGTPRKARRRG